MIDRPAGIGVGKALVNRLADVHLVRQVVPAGSGGELLDQAFGVVSDVRGVGHIRKLCGPKATRKLGASSCHNVRRANAL